MNLKAIFDEVSKMQNVKNLMRKFDNSNASDFKINISFIIIKLTARFR